MRENAHRQTHRHKIQLILDGISFRLLVPDSEIMDN